MRGAVWVTLLACLMPSPTARSDGGAVILVEREQGRSWTLLMRPARPVVGAVEFDLIGLGGEDAQLELRQGEEPGLVHSFEPGPSPRVAHVRTAFERPGSCVIRLRAPGRERSPEIRIEVGPPSVSVLERLPWILAWIPMCLLLWMRSRALRSRLYTPGRR